MVFSSAELNEVASRRHLAVICTWILLAFSTALVACPPGEQATPQRKPNIILIVLDTVRADHLGSYGYSWDTSPNLDALARDGVVFERTISPSPWTIPAIGSILTSTYPSEHHAGERPSEAVINPNGTVNWSALGKMDPTLPTIASLLDEHGWTTHAILASPWIRGFGLFPETYDQVDDAPGDDFAGLSRAAKITDAAVQVIETARDGPVFLVVHYIDPHAPYDPTSAVLDDDVQQYSQRETLSPSRSRAIANYDQEIRDMDNEIGRLLDSLRAKHHYADSLIIVIADHGEELWDHDQRETMFGPTVMTPVAHGHTFYQELLHVPFIIKYPGLESKGLRDPRLASSMDVMPTILDVVGIHAPENLRGVSLVDRQAGVRDKSELDSRFVISEHPIYNDDRKAVVQGALKYILNTETRSERFIDLASKDFRDRDVSHEIPEARKRHMRQLMEQTLKGKTSAPERFVDQETLEQMRALGYIE